MPDAYGYEYKDGVYHKDGKYYDKIGEGYYQEYDAVYKNEDGYKYWEGSFHKDGKNYDYTGDETTPAYEEYDADYAVNEDGYNYW